MISKMTSSHHNIQEIYRYHKLNTRSLFLALDYSGGWGWGSRVQRVYLIGPQTVFTYSRLGITMGRSFFLLVLGDGLLEFHKVRPEVPVEDLGCTEQAPKGSPHKATVKHVLTCKQTQQVHLCLGMSLPVQYYLK